MPGVHQAGLVVEAGLDLRLGSSVELITLLVRVEKRPTGEALKSRLVRVDALPSGKS